MKLFFQVLQDDLQLAIPHHDQSDPRTEGALKMHEIPRQFLVDPLQVQILRLREERERPRFLLVKTLPHPGVESRLSRIVNITIMHPEPKRSIVHGTASKIIYWRPYTLSWHADKQCVNPNRDMLVLDGFFAVALQSSADRRLSFDFFLHRRAHVGVQVEFAVPFLSSSVIPNIWESGTFQGR